MKQIRVEQGDKDFIDKVYKEKDITQAEMVSEIVAFYKMFCPIIEKANDLDIDLKKYVERKAELKAQNVSQKAETIENKTMNSLIALASDEDIIKKAAIPSGKGSAYARIVLDVVQTIEENAKTQGWRQSVTKKWLHSGRETKGSNYNIISAFYSGWKTVLDPYNDEIRKHNKMIRRYGRQDNENAS